MKPAFAPPPDYTKREAEATCGLITAEMTDGMSSVEVWIVMFAAIATPAERVRLAAFFSQWAEVAAEKNPDWRFRIAEAGK